MRLTCICEWGRPYLCGTFTRVFCCFKWWRRGNQILQWWGREFPELLAAALCLNESLTYVYMIYLYIMNRFVFGINYTRVLIHYTDNIRYGLTPWVMGLFEATIYLFTHCYINPYWYFTLWLGYDTSHIRDPLDLILPQMLLTGCTYRNNFLASSCTLSESPCWIELWACRLGASQWSAVTVFCQLCVFLHRMDLHQSCGHGVGTRCWW